MFPWWLYVTRPPNRGSLFSDLTFQRLGTVPTEHCGMWNVTDTDNTKAVAVAFGFGFMAK